MHTRLLAPIASLLFLAGCHNPDPVKAPYTPTQDMLTRTTYPNITASGEIAGWLVFDRPTVTHDNVLRVSVPLRTTAEPGQWIKVQYRFIFLDANNVPVRGQPDWQPMTMEPRQQVFMQANSLDSNATDWRLEIRPQR
jgi:uncharacterized protein YcfL